MRKLFANRRKFKTTGLHNPVILSPRSPTIGYGQNSAEWLGSTGNARYPNNKLAVNYDGGVIVAGGGTVATDSAAMVDIWLCKDFTLGATRSVIPSFNIDPISPAGYAGGYIDGYQIKNCLLEYPVNIPLRTGGSVAVSGDGKTVLFANCSTHSTNAVYGLLWDPTLTWNGVSNHGGYESMIGLPAPGYTMGVGSSLSLSYDGLVAAIGGYRYTNTNSQQGSVDIYTRSSGSSSWSLAQTILSPNPTLYGHFGISCELSYDGTRLVVGAAGELTNNGRVYVYDYSGGTWSLSHTINPGITSGSASAGYMVTGNKDLTLLAVGIPCYDAPGGRTDIGIVYIYKYNGSSYSLVQQVTSLDPNNNYGVWGCSVSMTANGQYLTIGQQNQSSISYSNPIYKWNPNTDTYSLLQNLPVDVIAGANIQLSGNGKCVVSARSNTIDNNLEVYRR